MVVYKWIPILTQIVVSLIRQRKKQILGKKYAYFIILHTITAMRNNMSSTLR